MLPGNGTLLAELPQPPPRSELVGLDRLRSEAYLASPVAQIVVTADGLVALTNRQAEVERRMVRVPDVEYLRTPGEPVHLDDQRRTPRAHRAAGRGRRVPGGDPRQRAGRGRRGGR